MLFSSKPVKGTFDVVPEDLKLRRFILDTARAEYEKKGYLEIETPMLENLELLTGSEGGENLSLLFKILKRGEKLRFDDLSENALADLALRYDLTVSLSRFYAEHQNDLPKPFKAFQSGYVFRAERPQKMRYRSFRQCDIDIIGDETIAAETDLLITVPNVLKKLGFTDYTVRLSDRRILSQLLLQAGVAQSALGKVYITIDKMDKIGPQGVERELSELLGDSKVASIILASLSQNLAQTDSAWSEDLFTIAQVAGDYHPVEVDFSLVRGMGYYTGPIFEIVLPDFSGSVGGGGRYDNLMSKFRKESTPAVGFSIGFERIADIMKARGWKDPQKSARKAILVYRNEQLPKAAALVQEATDQGQSAAFFMCQPKKTGQMKKRLENAGYTEFIVLESDAF